MALRTRSSRMSRPRSWSATIRARASLVRARASLVRARGSSIAGGLARRRTRRGGVAGGRFRAGRRSNRLAGARRRRGSCGGCRGSFCRRRRGRCRGRGRRDNGSRRHDRRRCCQHVSHEAALAEQHRAGKDRHEHADRHDHEPGGRAVADVDGLLGDRRCRGRCSRLGLPAAGRLPRRAGGSSGRCGRAGGYGSGPLVDVVVRTPVGALVGAFARVVRALVVRPARQSSRRQSSRRCRRRRRPRPRSRPSRPRGQRPPGRARCRSSGDRSPLRGRRLQASPHAAASVPSPARFGPVRRVTPPAAP